MKLSKVTITNFRCFESLDIVLNPDVNVFVGVNGAGKTTILDAIAMALFHIVAANRGVFRGRRNVQGVQLTNQDIHLDPNSSKPVTDRKDHVQIQATAGDFYELPGYLKKTSINADNFIEWTDYIQYSPPNDFTYCSRTSEQTSQIYGYIRALWQEIRKSGESALIPLPVVAYYRSNRSFKKMPKMDDIFNFRPHREVSYEGALIAGVDYQHMCKWFYIRENSELREKLQRRNDLAFEFPELKAVRWALSQVLENVEKVYFKDNPPSLMVDFREPGGSPKSMELEQLSDGYRNLLALVLDFARRLAQANPGWENPLEAPGILLIDEIELHLHPGWQQEVVPNLRKVFPNTQLIIATHSPQVLTTVKREHVKVLTSDHQLAPLPKEIGTYGAESASALEMVFGIHSRPQSIETVGNLQKYLRMVENRQHASENAKLLRAELEENLGTSDPDLIRADMRIRQLEILSKR